MTTTKTAADFLTSTIAAGKTPRPFTYSAYRANVDRAGGDETQCCAFCGKRAAGAKFFGYLTAAGEFTTVPEGDALNDDLGFYPLGSDCARLLKASVPVYGAPDKGHPRVK